MLSRGSLFSYSEALCPFFSEGKGVSELSEPRAGGTKTLHCSRVPGQNVKKLGSNRPKGDLPPYGKIYYIRSVIPEYRLTPVIGRALRNAHVSAPGPRYMKTLKKVIASRFATFG